MKIGVTFWEGLCAQGVMNKGNIILGGDLNFTIGGEDILGNATHKDPLSDFFKIKIYEARLVDIESIELIPTWRNMRVGEEILTKRLDKIIISNAIVLGCTRIRKWVGINWDYNSSSSLQNEDEFLNLP